MLFGGLPLANLGGSAIGNAAITGSKYGDIVDICLIGSVLAFVCKFRRRTTLSERTSETSKGPSLNGANFAENCFAASDNTCFSFQTVSPTAYFLFSLFVIISLLLFTGFL